MDLGMETTLDYRVARRRMVEEQLCPKGITDERLLEAFLNVPRHLFIDPALGRRAYDDCSFPIGYDQTISQPFTIAFMIQALEIGPDDRVLEIGTGSGYQSAILSLLAKEVYSIERITSLAIKAEEVLRTIKTGRIRLKVGDGSKGWKGYAPFDRIIVSAVTSDKPDMLLSQLTLEGKLIVPMAASSEYIMLFTRRNGRFSKRRLKRCAFVPLQRGVD
jgi:protein-L-isoaspartate(D-aspartate) O-methyltransferase